MTSLNRLVSTRITEETYQKLQNIAEKYNLNMAQVLRFAIEVLILAEGHGAIRKEKKEGEHGKG